MLWDVQPSKKKLMVFAFHSAGGSHPANPSRLPNFPANCGLLSGVSSRSWSLGTKDEYEKAASEQKTIDRKAWRPKSLAVQIFW